MDHTFILDSTLQDMIISNLGDFKYMLISRVFNNLTDIKYSGHRPFLIVDPFALESQLVSEWVYGTTELTPENAGDIVTYINTEVHEKMYKCGVTYDNENMGLDILVQVLDGLQALLNINAENANEVYELIRDDDCKWLATAICNYTPLCITTLLEYNLDATDELTEHMTEHLSKLMMLAAVATQEDDNEQSNIG